MSRTPSFEEVLDQAIDEKLVDMHTCLPAMIDSYDAAKQEATVKVALMRKYDDGTLVERPVIPNVRVQFPKGGNSSLTFPLKKGDDGFLMFSERSLERWRVGAGVVDPKDSRKFHLSDCFFVPMAARDSDVVAGASDEKTRLVNDKSVVELDESGTILVKNDIASVEINSAGLIELKNANGKIRITANGRFKIEGQKELLEIVERFIQTMNAATTLTALGLQPFFPPTPAALAQLELDIQSIREM